MRKGIKFKILGVYILLLVVLATSSIWSVTTFNRLSNSIENIMQSNYNSIVAAQNMIVAIERQDSAELAHMFSSDEVATQIFRENEIEFLKWLSRAEDNITEPGEKENLQQIHELYMRYIDEFSILVDLQKNQGAGEARTYYYNEVLPLFENTKDACRNLQNLNQEGMLKRKDNAHGVSTNASYSTIIVSSITILIGLFFAVYLTNKIVNPIYNLIDKIKKIADGDYSQQLDIVGKDEIAELAKEFNVMTRKLQSFDLLNFKKLMEEKQKAEAIVESISDGIIVTNEEHKLLLVNRAAETALNIREKDVLHKHFLEVIKREDIFQIINKVKDRSNVDNYKKYTDITIDGESKKKHYRMNVTPIRTKEGDNIGFVTLLQDITKLKEVDQIKSDFVSTVSHEFRTPLTSISMGVGLLLDNIPGPVNNDQRELLEAIREDGDRLKNLVSDLLDLSRIESGKIQMDIGSYDLKDIIDNAVKPFNIQTKDKKTEIQVHVRDGLAKVKADFNKISWVLTNLIGNALRYTPIDGTGRIEIEAKETANKMLICVSDNGRGIPEDYQQKIFEKFIQVKNENGETSGGTGLGLAISKEIVNAHGGEIWVESQLGEGSSFYFTLNLGR
ncbi:HAMP domain-containing sensor histidine kinase [Anaerosolibacter sp.]|uniref:HAMP domain-containing sensor histidine kinase n=1 Tax=Anaerosolibacter sp. TaxID=1872527 RepID=UPI0039EE5453